MLTQFEKDILFHIVRIAIGRDEADMTLLREPFSWKAVVGALDDHKMVALCADAILSLPDELQPEETIRDFILECLVNTVRTHYRLNESIAELFGKLEDGGFEPVLLKGEGLSRLYPSPYIRSCGDIDVFIGAERFWDACDVVNDFCGGTGEERNEEFLMHWAAAKGDIIVEVHRRAALPPVQSVMDEYNTWATSHLKASAAKDDRLFLDTTKNADFNGKNIRVPGPLFNCIYVFGHLAEHLRVTGIGLRQFVDWLLVLQKANEDSLLTDDNIKTMEHVLKHFHMLDAWQVLGGILVYQMGLKTSEFPLWNERKARHSQGSNLQYILDAKNLGQGVTASRGYVSMPRSLRRELAVIRYNWHYLQYEYHLFPHDTIKKALHRAWTRLSE